LDSPAKPLKRVGKTERIVSQIFIDVFFNQDMAMRTGRFCQNAESGQAWPELVHLISWKSPFAIGRKSTISTTGAVSLRLAPL
jgi:hypothetical protein